MNKKIGFILALVLIAFLVMGTASAGLFDFLGGGNSTAKVTNNDSNLIVGFDAEFPPYGFSDGKGGYQGFDLDLAQEVCNRNNWTLVKQPIDWDAKDAELNSGTIDCIWNGFTINGRENDYTWSEPYIDNKQVVVDKKLVKEIFDKKTLPAFKKAVEENIVTRAEKFSLLNMIKVLKINEYDKVAFCEEYCGAKLNA